MSANLVTITKNPTNCYCNINRQRRLFKIHWKDYLQPRCQSMSFISILKHSVPIMHARRSSFHHFPFVWRCGLQVEIVPSVPTDELRKRCCVSPLLKSKVVWLYLVRELKFLRKFSFSTWKRKSTERKWKRSD